MAYQPAARSVEIVRKTVIVLLFVLLVTPLLLSSKFFFPYISTKTFFVRLILEIAAVLYVILVVADRRYLPRLSPISWAVFLYTAIIFITSLAGVNFYRSFWGNTERGEGILTFLHIVAFFVMASGIFRDWRMWERFFIGSIIVSFISVIYATLQRFGASFVVAGDISRLSALIGNASFYAGYLLVHVFLCLWFVLRKREVWKKLFFGSVLIYELVIIFATQTRGAILGLAISALLFMALAAFLNSSTKQKIAFGSAIAILVALSVGIYLLRDTPTIMGVGSLARLTHMGSSDITTESRLLTWQASWLAFKDRIFLGYGYENFNVAFNTYFPAKIFRDAGSQIWFDRAHNIVIDVAISSGVFGLLAYISLFGLTMWVLFRFYRADPKGNRWTAIVFTSLLVGYFVQNLFVFDTLSTYLAFYALLAFLSVLSATRPTDKNLRYPPPADLNPLLTVGLILVFSLISYFAVFRPVTANLTLTNALIATAEKDLPSTLDDYKKVIAMDTYATEEARQKLAEAALTFRNSNHDSLDLRDRVFQTAIAEMQKAVDKAPLDARNYMFLMALYNNQPQQTAGSLQEVIRLGKEVEKLSPTRPQIYYEMGQAAHGLGRYDEGIGYFQKAIQLNPYPIESHWNLAMAYLIANKLDEAKKELDQMFLADLKISAISDSSIRNAIQIFKNRLMFAETVRYYVELLRRTPNDSTLRLELAEVYGRLCDEKLATDQAELAIKINPNLEVSRAQIFSALQSACVTSGEGK